MSVLTQLRDDRVTIDRLLDAVTNGEMSAVPLLCESVLRHSELEEQVMRSTDQDSPLGDAESHVLARMRDEHQSMRQTIMEIGEANTVDQPYLAHVSTLVGLMRGHPDPYAPGEPPPQDGAVTAASGDEGASSDGDQSWAQAPITQDPSVDRSVDAVIKRTRGQ